MEGISVGAGVGRGVGANVGVTGAFVKGAGVGGPGHGPHTAVPCSRTFWTSSFKTHNRKSPDTVHIITESPSSPHSWMGSQFSS